MNSWNIRNVSRCGCELGSSLAHEINQPQAIRNYSEGGLLRISKNKPLTDIEPVFEKIQSQVDRADADLVFNA